MNESGMKWGDRFEVTDDTECPRCGNTKGNRDAGPYEFVPTLDIAIGGPFDDCVHCIWCARCGKPFDVAPEEYVLERFQDDAAFAEMTRGLEGGAA